MKMTNSTVEEFKRLCDEHLAKAKITKKVLAHSLRLDPTYFSRLYNGGKPIPSHILERVKQLELIGPPPLPIPTQHSPPAHLHIDQNLANLLYLIPGQLKQLTDQVALLQGEVGKITGRLTTLEKSQQEADGSEKKRR